MNHLGQETNHVLENLVLDMTHSIDEALISEELCGRLEDQVDTDLDEIGKAFTQKMAVWLGPRPVIVVNEVRELLDTMGDIVGDHNRVTCKHCGISHPLVDADLFISQDTDLYMGIINANEHKLWKQEL